MLIRKEQLLEQLDGYAKDSMLPVSVVRSMVMKAYEVDAVPVTRCKDCMYYKDYYCTRNDHGCYDDSFCSYADK